MPTNQMKELCGDNRRKKILGWSGLLVSLVFSVILFFSMMAFAALSASPNYPRDRAVYIMQFMGIGLVLCLLAVIIFTVFLYKIYDLHLLESFMNWCKTKGGNPWDT